MITRSHVRCANATLASLIKSHCIKTESKGDAMRSLIKSGLKSGTLPLGGRPSVCNTQTIGSLLANFEACDFYDFKPISDQLKASLHQEQCPSDVLGVLSWLTRLGYYDERTVLLCCSSIVQNDGIKLLSVAEKAEFIGLLAAQRLRVPGLINAILDDAIPKMTECNKSRLQLDLALLGLSLPHGHDVQAAPKDVRACMDVAKAILLTSRSSVSDASMDALMIECIERMATSPNKFKARDISLLWHSINFCHPEMYEALPDTGKRWLVSHATVELATCSQRARMEDFMKFTDSVSDTLFKLGVRNHKQVGKGPFTADIQEASGKLIWLCDKPSRFYRGPESHMRTAYFELQDKVFTAMGYKVAHVPFWHWSRITSPKTRREYLKMTRFSTGSASPTSLVSVTQSSVHPTCFEVKNFVSNHYQRVGYNGETFLRKELPKSSWSWHGTSSIPLRVTL